MLELRGWDVRGGRLFSGMHYLPQWCLPVFDRRLGLCSLWGWYLLDTIRSLSFVDMRRLRRWFLRCELWSDFMPCMQRRHLLWGKFECMYKLQCWLVWAGDWSLVVPRLCHGRILDHRWGFSIVLLCELFGRHVLFKQWIDFMHFVQHGELLKCKIGCLHEL